MFCYYLYAWRQQGDTFPCGDASRVISKHTVQLNISVGPDSDQIKGYSRSPEACPIYYNYTQASSALMSPSDPTLDARFLYDTAGGCQGPSSFSVDNCIANMFRAATADPYCQPNTTALSLVRNGVNAAPA